MTFSNIGHVGAPTIFANSVSCEDKQVRALAIEAAYGRFRPSVENRVSHETCPDCYMNVPTAVLYSADGCPECR